MKPIVKWAGGKTQLLPEILPIIPEFNTYYEAFAGGLALFFELNPKKAVINDINIELINLYRQVAKNPKKLFDGVEALDNEHSASKDGKQFFYNQRDLFNSNLETNTIDQAIRFIYLNKHCFNGLYRVNSKGYFNVPFNSNNGGSSQELDNLKDISKLLNKTEILCGDFEASVKKAKKGDFVFFDSPYAPLNPTSFTDYTKEGFGYDEHVRLANLYKKLSKRGVKCMLTNHNTDLIHELYKDFNIKIVDVHRNINSKADNRKGQEVIITNYEQ